MPLLTCRVLNKYTINNVNTRELFDSRTLSSSLPIMNSWYKSLMWCRKTRMESESYNQSFNQFSYLDNTSTEEVPLFATYFSMVT